MSQTENGHSVILNTLATGVAGVGFDVVPPIVETVTIENHAVDYSSVRHRSGVSTPRRIRGHDGSTGYNPDESECARIPGYDRLSRLSPDRRLELLGTMLIHCENVSAAWRAMRDFKCNRIGFGDCAARTTRQNSHRLPIPRAVSLRDVVRMVDDSRAESESLADSIVIYLDRLESGFGTMLMTTDNVTIAAKLCGLSARAGYRLVETVRDSWQSSFDPCR